MQIGIIGAGMIGATLAKLWVDAGHEVRLASRHPEDLQPLVATLGPRPPRGGTVGILPFAQIPGTKTKPVIVCLCHMCEGAKLRGRRCWAKEKIPAQ